MSSALESGHGPDCQCTRCAGFAAGNDVAVRHGAHVSTLRLAPRVEEVAQALRDAMPHHTASFDPAVQATAVAGVRLERALTALEDAAPGQLDSLDHRARGWHRAWLAGLEKLGLTPLAASRMGLDLELARSARAGLAARYGEGADR